MSFRKWSGLFVSTMGAVMMTASLYDEFEVVLFLIGTVYLIGGGIMVVLCRES